MKKSTRFITLALCAGMSLSITNTTQAGRRYSTYEKITQRLKKFKTIKQFKKELESIDRIDILTQTTLTAIRDKFYGSLKVETLFQKKWNEIAEQEEWDYTNKGNYDFERLDNCWQKKSWITNAFLKATIKEKVISYDDIMKIKRATKNKNILNRALKLAGSYGNTKLFDTLMKTLNFFETSSEEEDYNDFRPRKPKRKVAK